MPKKKSAGKNLVASVQSPGPSPESVAREEQYQIESHLRTLGEAADIMSDPEKMRKVHKLAGRRHKALKAMMEMGMSEDGPVKNLADLKKRAHTMRDDDEDMS